MSLQFSGPEVMEMAVQTEKGGRVFYETVAAATTDPKLAELFRYLAGEEVKHIAVFQSFARELKEKPEELAYNWEEAVPYLKALTDSRYFLGEQKAVALAGSAATPSEALEHAIGFEKETLLFYREMLDMVAERNRDALQKLIAEEKTHVVKLSRLREALQSG